MTSKDTNTSWFDAAVQFAVEAHAGQARKGTSKPYIVHPLRVALILERYNFPRALVVAALLHDVVEDTDATIDDVSTRFGDEVAALVSAVTEQKVEGGKRRPWKVRKQEALNHLKRLPRQVAALKAADALDNVRSSLVHHREIGNKLWERFNAGPGEQAWYYGGLADAIRESLGDHPLANELSEAVAELVELANNS